MTAPAPPAPLVPSQHLEAANAAARSHLEQDYLALQGLLERRGLLARSGRTIDDLTSRILELELAMPSWGLGTGGTRFGRFPGPGEPGSIFEKLEDASVVQTLTGGAPAVSLHLPWDRAEPAALVESARVLGLRFDAINSNTFQDQSGQGRSYKFGSLSHPDRAVRRQAIEHNLEVVEFGRRTGSRALTVWLSDGADAPGQLNFRRSHDRVLESLQEIYRALPPDWRLLLEYKPYEPAFYATVIPDWGTALSLCQALGERAQVLVDLGHHLPGTNIEQIVARLAASGRLGGFHFNDSRYGDDDLAAGSIKPYQLFLIFCELVDAQREARQVGKVFQPAYMIDQSHNTRDPIEALIVTVEELGKAHARALLVDWQRLADFQDSCDSLGAEMVLKNAFDVDVRPLLAMARLRRRAAIDPLATFRSSGYRDAKSRERRADRKTAGGIV